MDFNISISPNRHSNYLLTVYLDPEVMCMSGDKYNPDSDSFLDNVGANKLAFSSTTTNDLLDFTNLGCYCCLFHRNLE